MSDRYQIQGKIGQGGLGAVYKAFDTQLKREVALKRVLTPEQADQKEVDEAAEKLLQEATVLSTLNHPNIVTVFDVGQDESGGFVVMELLDGETLDQTISRGLLTLDDFTEVVNQTLEALIAAQAVNMMHRDLKPSNVMVIWRPSGKFQIKVLDFGLAKISESPSIQTIDQGDAILGSIYFMAPEQFERRRLDFRTDMYALGCIYYNTLTGKYPFDGDTAPQVMAAHLQHKVKPLREMRPDLPEEVCQWVMWLINRDMTKRPMDAREALERYPGAGNGSGPVYVSQTPTTTNPTTTSGPVVARPAGPGPGRIPSATGAVPRGNVTGSIPSSATTGHQATGMVHLAEQEAERKKRMTVLLISLVTGSILIGVGIFVATSQLQVAKERQRIAELVSDPDGTPRDVAILVKHLNPKEPDPRAGQLLANIEGGGVDDAIIEALSTSKPGTVRSTLLSVVAARSLSEAFPIALRIAQNPSSDRERSAAITAMASIAKDTHLTDLTALLAQNLNGQDRRKVEDAVIDIVLESPNVEGRTSSMLGRMDSASGEERRSLCRIVGSAGGKTALARMERIIQESEDAEYRKDAVFALNCWPDRMCRDLLIDLMDNSAEPAIKIAATRAFVRMIGIPANTVNDSALWDRAFAATESGTDINKIFIAIIDRPNNNAVNYLKNGTIKGYESMQQKALERVQEEIAQAIPFTTDELILVDSAKQIKGEPGGAYFNEAGKYVEQWTEQGTWVQWLLDVQEPGTYQVEVFMSCRGLAKSRYIIFFGGTGQPLYFNGQPTGEWDSFRPLKVQKTFRIPPNKKGPHVFAITAGKVVEPRMMNVKGIRFTKVSD